MGKQNSSHHGGGDGQSPQRHVTSSQPNGTGRRGHHLQAILALCCVLAAIPASPAAPPVAAPAPAPAMVILLTLPSARSLCGLPTSILTLPPRFIRLACPGVNPLKWSLPAPIAVPPPPSPADGGEHTMGGDRRLSALPLRWCLDIPLVELADAGPE